MFTRKINSKHRPASNLDKYEKEEYMDNPLLRFHLDNLYKRRHLELLKLRAAEIKAKLSENDLEAKLEPSLSTAPRNIKELSHCREGLPDEEGEITVISYNRHYFNGNVFPKCPLNQSSFRICSTQKNHNVGGDLERVNLSLTDKQHSDVITDDNKYKRVFQDDDDEDDDTSIEDEHKQNTRKMLNVITMPLHHFK
uniref:Uncharacterized protein n=1 Tax=Glossina pallidipes TaxID=7398 RepID=A0A1B0A9L8_GLOPL